ASFPSNTERVVLNVAANQAAIALQSAVALAEQKRITDALRAREADVRLLVDGIPALAVGLSPSGALEHANRRTLDYFGMTFEEIKEGGRDLINPDRK